MSQQTENPSIFINVAAWLLLCLVFLAGLVALFSATGAITQIFKIGDLEVHTTSTAIMAMVIASVPFWSILHYALRGKIILFEYAPQPWMEEHAQLLEVYTAIVGIGGACILLYLWLWN